MDRPIERREALRQAIEQAQKKPCIKGGQCKHGSWCSEVYCQEHCEFVEQAQKQEPVALKHRLVKIHDALCNKLGDTDPYIDEDMTDEEICKELPVFWAAKEIADLIGDAPWTDYTSPPQRQPLTDEVTQIAEALRRHGLTLVKTAKGYDVMNLGQITAHGIGEQK